jgi:hypothetical protein
MAAVTYKQIACYITPEQHALLKQLSDETKVPMQALLRQGVSMLLGHYKKLPKKHDDEYASARIYGIKRGAIR